MITLATLAAATAQQVFDQIAIHLLTQGARSKLADGPGRVGSCKYRDGVGRSCAAGCLIADLEYEEAMEGTAWRSFVHHGWAPEQHVDLIGTLQTLHDGSSDSHLYQQMLGEDECSRLRRLTPLGLAQGAVPVSYWPMALVFVAAQYELNALVVVNFKPA